MDYVNKVICGDSLKVLKELPENIVTNVITSPPYNVNASKWLYNSHSDDMPYKEYLNWLKDIFAECHRVLRVGGRAIINIDAMTNRQEDKQEEYFRPIYADMVNLMKDIGFKFFGEHAWYKSNRDPSSNSAQFSGKKTAWGSFCSPSTPAIRRNHEYILLFSKGQFKLEKTEESGNPDISKEDFMNWIASTWCIHPETRKIGHPVPYPIELPLRAIKLYSYPNDIILDPFNGSGTTCLASKIAKRRYIGIDIDEGYCKLARERIETESKNIFEE